MSQAFPELVVLSGPLFLPSEVSVDPDKGLSRYRRDGPKRYLKHEVLGSGVAVPTHLFKSYVVQRADGTFAMSAFVVPNGPVDGTKPLSEFSVSREQLSAMAGFEVLPKEPAVTEVNIV